jgi:hypothetical protein
MRPLTLRLSAFSVETLAGEQQSPGQVQAGLEQAVRLYLGDRSLGQPGWAYPGFLREREAGEVELEMVADDDLLQALEEEAERQDVTVSELVEHAVLYYSAELSAGRFTQRILDELESDDLEGGG